MGCKLIDVQAGFGGSVAGCRTVVRADELTDEMRRLDISRALARITPIELDHDFELSNNQLYDAVCAHGELIPCPIVVPNGARDLPSEAEQVDAHIRQGAGAVFIRPARDYWTLAPWACDHLFHALTERRLPVVCLEPLAPLEQVGAIAERHPTLPILLMQVNYRQQRALLPLLESFRNIIFVLGHTYSVHKGIEQICAVVGAERLLFGTGFPTTEPMAAVTQLMYADISAEERALIGAGNMERIMEEIVR